MSINKNDNLPSLKAKLDFNSNEPQHFNVPGMAMIPDDSNNKSNNDDFKGKDLIDGDDIIIEDKGKDENEIIHKKSDMTKIDEQNNNIKGESHKLPHMEKTNEDINVENEGENSLPYQKKITKAQKLAQDKLKVPPRLFKTFIITMILALVGVVLIILGCIQSIAEHTPGKGIMFWVLGGVVIIPGGFYSYQFFKAKRAKDDYQREDIFDNIPEL